MVSGLRKNKLNILIIAYACEPNNGSEEGSGWNLPFYLAQKDHEIHVITRTIYRKAIEEEFKKSPNLNLNFHYIDDFGKIKKFSFPLAFYYFESILWQFKAINYIRRSSINYELIHHVTWGGIYSGSLFWKLGKPFIFGPCGGGQTTSKKFKSCFGKNWKNEKHRNWAIRNYPLTSPTGSFPKHCDLLLATNEDTALLAKKAGAKRIELFLDSGLPDEFFPKTFPTRISSPNLKILWVGKLIPRKGLILAFMALKKCDFPLKLTIVGDGPIRSEMQKLAGDLGLNDKVIWLGRVPWTQVKSIYLQQDVFLFTSIRDSFGCQVLEAMACGLPVIALNQGGVKSLLPEKTLIKVSYVDPETTSNEISNELKRLWKDEKLRLHIGNEGYQYSFSESWSARAVKLENYYHQIVKQGK